MRWLKAMDLHLQEENNTSVFAMRLNAIYITWNALKALSMVTIGGLLRARHNGKLASPPTLLAV
jgi:hypothetical protein